MSVRLTSDAMERSMRPTSFHKSSTQAGIGTLLAASLALCTCPLAVIAGSSAPVPQSPSGVGASVLHVQGGIYLVSGFGANVLVQVGSQGILVVDTGRDVAKDKLLAAIDRLANARPIRYIINSNSDLDHVGGNEKLRLAGETIRGGNVALDDPVGQQGATVIAHEQAQRRMTSSSTAAQHYPEELWATETFAQEPYDLFFNEEAIQLFHPSTAHTNGDLLVFFRKSDVLAAGDVFLTTTYPVIDIEHGGSINGLIAGLNRIIDIAVPRDKQEGGTIVVPGHGRLCDEADVVEYRNMVTIIRDRISDMVSRGMTLEQVRAAKPSADYDARFGANRTQFVDSVYFSLRKTPDAVSRQAQ